MTKIELKALRQICFLTQAECAEHISRTSVRAWTHWENGARKVPHDVENKMKALVNFRAREMRRGIKLSWYDSYDSFRDAELGDYLDWRVSQSIAAQRIAESLS